MFIKTEFMKNVKMPDFKINDTIIDVVNKYTYLGHIICESLLDDLDIARQRKKIFAQGNCLLRKFYMCTIDVKVTLFKSYCFSFYTVQLWTKYTQNAINKLHIAYHDTLKLLIVVKKDNIHNPFVYH